MLRKRLNSILKNEASPPWLVTLLLSPCRWRVSEQARLGGSQEVNSRSGKHPKQLTDTVP